MRGRTSAASPVQVNAFSRSPSSNGRVAIGHAHEVLLVDREVTLGLGDLLDALAPLDAAGQRLDRRGIALVHRVVHDGEPGPAAASARSEPGLSPSSSTVPNASTEHQSNVGIARADRHHAVAELARDGEALGSVGGDDDRRVDRERRRELGAVQHLHDRAVDLDLLAPQQARAAARCSAASTPT